MDVTIRASDVAGRARAPPSKSYTHRAILAAGYGPSETTIEAPLVSADTRATMRAVEAFGGSVEMADERLRVTGFDGQPAVPADVIDCANSGTTIRLVTAAAALADGMTVLTGDASLRSRPQGPLLSAVDQLGGQAWSTRNNGQAPLVVTGPIDGGRVSIPGDVSSQFITALLMAGAVTHDGIEVALETELKSAPYVEITIELLDAFGVDARHTTDGFAVDGGQTYDPLGGTYQVPGDFSSLSYLLAAGAVAAPSGLRVAGARPSAQGDTAIVDVLDRMGANLKWDREAGEITVTQSSLSGVTVNVANTPDLLPTIAVLGAIANGTTRITECEHVRYKETDRVSAMAEALETLGAHIEEQQDELIVHGAKSALTGGHVDGRHDHRIIMALSIAGLVAEGPVTIAGAEHVDVSFPGFFELFEELGVTLKRQE